MSSSESARITDTVVLFYFLLDDEFALLEQLIGSPVLVPLAVYDPSEAVEPIARSDLQSELRQAARHYEAMFRAELDPITKTAAGLSRDRIQAVDHFHEAGRVATVSLEADERELSLQLQSRSRISNFGERVPVGPGEAACVAIAHHRSWTIVTDDQAALRIIERLAAEGPFAYDRIRRLLTRAVDEGAVSAPDAMKIHADMRRHGFWDSELLL